MYHYPFSNVYDDLRVCVGNNVLPHFKSQTQLSKFPRFLLGIPNNDDFFKESHNRLHMSHRELLEHLKDKEPAYYYTDVLVESGKTLSDFMQINYNKNKFLCKWIARTDAGFWRYAQKFTFCDLFP